MIKVHVFKVNPVLKIIKIHLFNLEGPENSVLSAY